MIPQLTSLFEVLRLNLDTCECDIIRHLPIDEARRFVKRMNEMSKRNKDFKWQMGYRNPTTKEIWFT